MPEPGGAETVCSQETTEKALKFRGFRALL